MNNYKWECEDYPYVKKIEEIPKSKLANAEKEEIYLYHTKNFKMRHKKLLNKITKKLEISNWH